MVSAHIGERMRKHVSLFEEATVAKDAISVIGDSLTGKILFFKWDRCWIFEGEKVGKDDVPLIGACKLFK